MNVNHPYARDDALSALGSHLAFSKDYADLARKTLGDQQDIVVVDENTRIA